VYHSDQDKPDRLPESIRQHHFLPVTPDKFTDPREAKTDENPGRVGSATGKQYLAGHQGLLSETLKAASLILLLMTGNLNGLKKPCSGYFLSSLHFWRIFRMAFKPLRRKNDGEIPLLDRFLAGFSNTC
jgi:hypothetical protein